MAGIWDPDVLDRYRWLGKGPNILDRRKWYASPDREDVPYEGHNPNNRNHRLSDGEKRARARFFHLTQGTAPKQTKPKDPVDAIFLALRLDSGPIPSVETEEAFYAYWSEDRLKEVATRWLRSSHNRDFDRVAEKQAAAKLTKSAHAAKNFLKEKAYQMAERLLKDAVNNRLKPADRQRAQMALLKMGIEAASDGSDHVHTPLPQDIKDLEQIAPALLNEALADPDQQRGRHRSELLRWMLAKANPEVYGDSLALKHSGGFDMTAVVADIQERKKAILAERNNQPTLELPASTSAQDPAGRRDL